MSRIPPSLSLLARRTLAGLVLLTALWAGRTAAADPVPAGAATGAQREATRMYQAFIGGDMKTFAGFTYPSIVQLAGGKDSMITIVQRGLSQMKAQGIAFKTAVVDPPSQIVHAGKETQAILPMNVIMTSPRGEIHSRTYLLGVSLDGGKKWTFLDGAKMTEETVKKIVPSFNSQLKLPPSTEPKLVPKP